MRKERKAVKLLSVSYKLMRKESREELIIPDCRSSLSEDYKAQAQTSLSLLKHIYCKPAPKCDLLVPTII
jgi:hypothetical protein